jgi:hypothetical protein
MATDTNGKVLMRWLRPAVLLLVSAVLGLALGIATSPRPADRENSDEEAVSLTTGADQGAVAKEASASTEPSPPSVKNDPTCTALERSLDKCLEKAGMDRPAPWSPSELLLLHESKEQIAQTLAQELESPTTRVRWLQLGIRVADALDDNPTQARYQRELSAVPEDVLHSVGASEESLLLQAVRRMREGDEAGAFTLIERVSRKEAPLRGKLLTAVHSTGDMGEREWLWAVRTAGQPSEAAPLVRDALKEFRAGEAATATWLALALGPEAEEAEELRLLLGKALVQMSERELALEYLRPLMKCRWAGRVHKEAQRLVVMTERELRYPPEELAAMERVKREVIENARKIRRAEEEHRQRLLRQGAAGEKRKAGGL